MIAMRKLSKSDSQLVLCVRATQTRSGAEKMPLLACKTNKARFRTSVIGSTMIGLTVYRTGLREVARVASDTEAIC